MMRERERVKVVPSECTSSPETLRSSFAEDGGGEDSLVDRDG